MNEKIMCYLTTEADTAVKTMVAAGLDPDLAVGVLEQLWPEEAIYDIPSREDASA